MKLKNNLLFCKLLQIKKIIIKTMMKFKGKNKLKSCFEILESQT